MPKPQVKRGTWVKPRSRNKDGTWRKKRKDAGKRRKSAGTVLVIEEGPIITREPAPKPKIVVECDVTKCTHNEEGYCTMDPLHLIVSFGRSTDYAHEFQCQDMEPSTAYWEP